MGVRGNKQRYRKEQGLHDKGLDEEIAISIEFERRLAKREKEVRASSAVPLPNEDTYVAFVKFRFCSRDTRRR